MAPVFGEKDMEEHCGDKAACIDEEREALNLKYSNNIVLFFFFTSNYMITLEKSWFFTWGKLLQKQTPWRACDHHSLFVLINIHFSLSSVVNTHCFTAQTHLCVIYMSAQSDFHVITPRD